MSVTRGLRGEYNYTCLNTNLGPERTKKVGNLGYYMLGNMSDVDGILSSEGPWN
jgi:hypothetical protein